MDYKEQFVEALRLLLKMKSTLMDAIMFKIGSFYESNISAEESTAVSACKRPPNQITGLLKSLQTCVEGSVCKP